MLKRLILLIVLLMLNLECIAQEVTLQCDYEETKIYSYVGKLNPEEKFKRQLIFKLRNNELYLDDKNLSSTIENNILSANFPIITKTNKQKDVFNIYSVRINRITGFFESKKEVRTIQGGLFPKTWSIFQGAGSCKPITNKPIF